MQHCLKQYKDVYFFFFDFEEPNNPFTFNISAQPALNETETQVTHIHPGCRSPSGSSHLPLHREHLK